MALCSEVEPPAAVRLIAASSSAWLPGERLPDLDPAVEVDHLRDVGRLEALDEVHRGRLQRIELVFHAGAAVEQQRQRDRLLAPVEEGDLLLHTVLEHREVALVQVGDVVTGRSRSRVTLSDTTSTPARNAGRRGSCEAGGTGWACWADATAVMEVRVATTASASCLTMDSPCSPAYLRPRYSRCAGPPRTVTPLRPDDTVTFVGVMSDSGRL